MVQADVIAMNGAESHTSVSPFSQEHKTNRQELWEIQLFPGDGGGARPAEPHHPAPSHRR